MMLYMYGVLFKCGVKIVAICSIIFLNTTVFMDQTETRSIHMYKKESALAANHSAGFSLAFPLTEIAI